jgi:hypothetical protein
LLPDVSSLHPTLPCVPRYTAEGGSFEHTDFDGSTAPKASSLSSDIVSKLLVSIDPEADASNVDLDALMNYQRAYVSFSHPYKPRPVVEGMGKEGREQRKV